MATRSVAALAAAVCAVLLAAAAVQAADVATRARPCKEGLTTIRGKRARVFCGPARATVEVGATTLTFRGGRCTKSGPVLIVNIGTIVLPSSGTLPYFGAVFQGRKASISFRGGTVHDSVVDDVRFKLKGKSGGTFSGRSLLGKRPVSGSFSC